MSKSIVDARGQGCPMPLMLTQKALKDAGISSPFQLFLSSQTAQENVERYLTDQKISYRLLEGDEIVLEVSK